MSLWTLYLTSDIRDINNVYDCEFIEYTAESI